MKPPDFLLLLGFLQFSAALAFGLSSDVTEHHHVAENNTDQHPDLSLAARVFSGNEAKAGVWPWQGVLVDVSTRGWPGRCGCVLISDQWVLTTARCVAKYTAKGKRLLFKFGAIFSRRPVGLRPIPHKQLCRADKIILHPEWNATYDNNNLAVVRLRGRVKLNKFVKPVALPSGNESLTDGSVCNITGWGKGSSTSLMLRLHQAQVLVLNNSECKLWIARAAEPAGDYVLSDNHLCTGSYDIYDKLENGCNGDNGGPLVRKKPYDPCNPNSISSDTPDDYELYGIFSAAVGTCGEAFSPAMYTRVQSYKSWILDSTGGLGMNEAVRAGRIVGGQNVVSIKQWPWQGYLYYSRRANELRDGEQFCGCSLIHKQWVITAAHCFFDKHLYKFIKVAFGKTSSDNLHVDTEQLREIAEVKKHKGYSQFKRNHDYDIAMVKLKNPVDITDNVRPVRLPEAGIEIAAWTVVNITGYGHTSYNGNSSIVLKQAQVPIVSRENCSEKYKSLEIQILETQLCAGYEEGGTDTCQGDSGGPLVWKAGRDVPEKCNDDPEGLETDDYVLAGIASYGEECAKPGFPGVYTRVSSYIEWINQQMSEGASRIGPDSAAEDVTRSDDKQSSAVRGGVDVVIIFVVTTFSILLVTLY